MRQIDFCKMKGISIGTFSSRRSVYYATDKKPKVHNENKNPFVKLGPIYTDENNFETRPSEASSKAKTIIFSNIPIQFEELPDPNWFAQLIIEFEKIKIRKNLR